MVDNQGNASNVAAKARRIFDCCLFNGEMEALAIRLHELDEAVDYFIIVESTLTFSGMPREVSFNARHPDILKFTSRIRHVVVADMPATSDPWVREAWQRNAVIRGAPDAAPTDILILSDVDEVPSVAAVTNMKEDFENEVFGFRLAFYYFYVNYRNTAGPETALIWNVAATKQALDRTTPDSLRYTVRDGRTPARIFENGGWHFSYLMDEAGIREKIASFSHQEFNNEEFKSGINVAQIVSDEGDLFNRPGFEWKLQPDTDLPVWLRKNRKRFSRLFHPTSLRERILDRFNWVAKPKTIARSTASTLPPVVICPYLYDHEEEEIRSKFRPKGKANPEMELFLWQDKDRIGPEFAFEHCWNQFPDRDIIIIHSDMAPMPGDHPNRWFEELSAYRDKLPSAGMIACNLFYPKKEPNESDAVQCAGGTFENNQIGHIHGPVVTASDQATGLTADMLRGVRYVDWVTFGGVLIRRDVIRACGPFDRRYKWAYVMDVDYSFEARLRGFQLAQVPVSLQHEENRTTKSLWEQKPELKAFIQSNIDTFYEKWAPFYLAMPSPTMTCSRNT